MDPAQQRYIEHCPVGCVAALKETDMVLPEGPLLRCAECSQLVSQCTEAEHTRSLERWDTTAGTSPANASATRYGQVSTRRLRKLLRLLRRQPQEVRLLDVGCSSGALLIRAREMGFEAEGVDPSARAAATARQAGFKVHTGPLEGAQFPDASFEAVTLIEVVEHLRDPRSLLVECRRILKPRGILLITTPNAASWTASVMGSRWQGFSLSAMGGHISFFNPKSVAAMARRTGFDTVRTETRNVRFLERGQFPTTVYAAAKIVSEMLNWPARILGKGHDLSVYLRRDG